MHTPRTHTKPQRARQDLQRSRVCTLVRQLTPPPAWVWLATGLLLALALTAAAQQPVTTLQIVTAIDHALDRNDGVTAALIDVEACNGLVTLSGMVNNNPQVDAEIVLPRGYSPDINGDWSLCDYDRYAFVERRPMQPTDAAMAEHTREELAWSPFVYHEDITVEVSHSQAVQTGTVDSWDERSATARNAYEDDAVTLDNNRTAKDGPALRQPAGGVAP